MLHNFALSTYVTYNSEIIICRRQCRRIVRCFSHLYFCQSLYTAARIACDNRPTCITLHAFDGRTGRKTNRRTDKQIL